MNQKTNFSVQLDRATRLLLSRLAELDQRKPGDFVRRLIRKEAAKRFMLRKTKVSDGQAQSA